MLLSECAKKSISPELPKCYNPSDCIVHSFFASLRLCEQKRFFTNSPTITLSLYCASHPKKVYFRLKKPLWYSTLYQGTHEKQHFAMSPISQSFYQILH